MDQDQDLKQSKAKQSKAKQSKAKQSKAKQSKAKQSKAKQSKAKQSKAKQSKVPDARSTADRSHSAWECRPGRSAFRSRRKSAAVRCCDAERHGLHSHAERGNDQHTAQRNMRSQVGYQAASAAVAVSAPSGG
ncbi:hypothetical protein [Pseudomonas sp. TMB3-21]